MINILNDLRQYVKRNCMTVLTSLLLGNSNSNMIFLVNYQICFVLFEIGLFHFYSEIIGLPFISEAIK